MPVRAMRAYVARRGQERTKMSRKRRRTESLVRRRETEDIITPMYMSWEGLVGGGEGEMGWGYLEEGLDLVEGEVGYVLAEAVADV